MGVDLLKKAVAARPSAFKGHKRLLLISSFDTQVRWPAHEQRQLA